MSDAEPWNIVKEAASNPEKRIALNWVIFNCAEALRIAGILLQPIMPTKATRLLDDLRVPADRRTIAYATRGADDGYGQQEQNPASRTRVSPWETIFPPTPAASYSDPEVLDMLTDMVENRSKNKLNKMSEWVALEARLGETGVKDLMQARSKPVEEKK